VISVAPPSALGSGAVSSPGNVENLPDLAALLEPLLIVRRALREQFGILHRRLLALVRDDEVCRRPMTVPVVGPRGATVDVPGVVRTDVIQISTKRQNITLREPARRTAQPWRCPGTTRLRNRGPFQHC
jgi:hypothetical protein